MSQVVTELIEQWLTTNEVQYFNKLKERETGMN
jgi:hypothetical protein